MAAKKRKRRITTKPSVQLSIKIIHFREDLLGECLSEEWEEGIADYSPDTPGFFDPSSSALVAAGRAALFVLFRGYFTVPREGQADPAKQSVSF